MNFFKFLNILSGICKITLIPYKVKNIFRNNKCNTKNKTRDLVVSCKNYFMHYKINL